MLDELLKIDWGETKENRGEGGEGGKEGDSGEELVKTFPTPPLSSPFLLPFPLHSLSFRLSLVTPRELASMAPKSSLFVCSQPERQLCRQDGSLSTSYEPNRRTEFARFMAMGCSWNSLKAVASVHAHAYLQFLL